MSIHCTSSTGGYSYERDLRELLAESNPTNWAIPLSSPYNPEGDFRSIRDFIVAHIQNCFRVAPDKITRKMNCKAVRYLLTHYSNGEDMQIQQVAFRRIGYVRPNISLAEAYERGILPYEHYPSCDSKKYVDRLLKKLLKGFTVEFTEMIQKATSLDKVAIATLGIFKLLSKMGYLERCEDVLMFARAHDFLFMAGFTNLEILEKLYFSYKRDSSIFQMFAYCLFLQGREEVDQSVLPRSWDLSKIQLLKVIAESSIQDILEMCFDQTLSSEVDEADLKAIFIEMKNCFEGIQNSENPKMDLFYEQLQNLAYDYDETDHLSSLLPDITSSSVGNYLVAAVINGDQFFVDYILNAFEPYEIYLYQSHIMQLIKNGAFDFFLSHDELKHKMSSYWIERFFFQGLEKEIAPHSNELFKQMSFKESISICQSYGKRLLEYWKMENSDVSSFKLMLRYYPLAFLAAILNMKEWILNTFYNFLDNRKILQYYNTM
ncbi:MAG TPA: hypothetical protein P5048_03195 [Chlamydiales bacterium]|nr:hypothetical protein [Chlamydiales bacterium]